jgi:hypothetical protein
MARPHISYFSPLLNGSRKKKIGCKHYFKLSKTVVQS